MKSYVNPPASNWMLLSQRPLMSSDTIDGVVRGVFDRVENNGDVALKLLTEQFDKVVLTNLVAEKSNLQPNKELQRAIDVAYKNITTFHKAQVTALDKVPIETTPGVYCWREVRPIKRVGLYVPGGSAPLISTVLMLGVPAQLVGCKEIILCTPPQSDGSVNEAIQYAASLVGVTRIFRIGGAQAIAAMSIGTESVPKVDKIFGPGNQYVTAAKMYAQKYGVAIDMPAGPSEVMVVADETAIPRFVAADLLSQAEHGPDSQVVLVTTSTKQARAVRSEANEQLKKLTRRDIATRSIENSFIVVFDKIDNAFEFANQYAPEHLILAIKNPKLATAKVQNAGSVFLGNYTPESAGDYASGTNHTLPTGGWARSYGGVSLESFCKSVTFQELSQAGLQTLATTIENLALAEGLDGHARAVTIRLGEK